MNADAPPRELADLIETLIRSNEPIDLNAQLAYRLLSGGNSHVTWRISTGRVGGDFVVKVAQPDGPLAPYDVGHEAAMMKQAGAAGVPAPALVGVHQDGDIQFLVMRLVDGDSPSLWEVRDWLAGSPDLDRVGIGRDLLSTLPLLSEAAASSDSQAELYTPYICDLVDRLAAAAKGVIELPPTILAARDWLLSRLPMMEAPAVLCHGDFRLGNAVFKDGRIAALLDWERAMIGHPLHDLGFLCLPGMKLGEHICGVLTQDELALAWRDVTGQQFDLRGVAYFKILAVFSELCLMIRAMARLAQGTGRLTGIRPLPLISRLHDDLVKTIRRWDDADFAL